MSVSTTSHPLCPTSLTPSINAHKKPAWNMVDAQDDVRSPSLTTLIPPEPPVDIVQSALFLPISSISVQHKGRKVRTIGQILAYEPKAGIILLSAAPNCAQGQISTLLVNVSTPLLGMTPALRDPATAEGTIYSRDSFSSLPSSKQASGRRENLLKLDRGEFVTVVGWLEGDGTKLVERVNPGSAYVRPLDTILEAIHIVNSRCPPADAIYPGDLPV